MKKLLKSWIMTVSVIGLIVLNISVDFPSNKDWIVTGNVHSNSLDSLASQTCNKEGKVITFYQMSSAPFRNTMLFSLQYSTALDVTLLISTR